MVEPIAEQNIAAQERNLIGLDRHQSGGKPRQCAVEYGRSVEPPRKQPQREGEKDEALNLSDMLNAPCRRRAEGECDGGDDACTGMPTPVLAEFLDGYTAKAE